MFQYISFICVYLSFSIFQNARLPDSLSLCLCVRTTRVSKKTAINRRRSQQGNLWSVTRSQRVTISCFCCWRSPASHSLTVTLAPAAAPAPAIAASIAALPETSPLAAEVPAPKNREKPNQYW